MILKGRILDACLAFCAIAAPLMLINFYEAAPIVGGIAAALVLFRPRP
jgi:hypothetical protein